MKRNLKKLIDTGVLKSEKGVGIDQINKRLARALQDLKNAKLLITGDEIGAYRMAYDAMLQAGLSLLLYYGFRPVVRNFHKTVVMSSKIILGKDYYNLIKQFDQMRRNRNEVIYEISTISKSEAKASIIAAEELINKIIKYIKTENPQKELIK